ncbi:hypothetical protein GGI43DRAFT_295102 [Trichoderma evansii]
MFLTPCAKQLQCTIKLRSRRPCSRATGRGKRPPVGPVALQFVETCGIKSHTAHSSQCCLLRLLWVVGRRADYPIGDCMAIFFSFACLFWCPAASCMTLPEWAVRLQLDLCFIPFGILAQRIPAEKAATTRYNFAHPESGSDKRPKIVPVQYTASKARNKAGILYGNPSYVLPTGAQLTLPSSGIFLLD